jgi:3-oxoacyl-[acyl-carrier-protein] synthase-3
MTQSGEPHDSWLGDAGTAVVLGPVAEGKGVLGWSHHTDGTLYKALVCGIPGKRWFDEGAVIAYSEDHAQNLNMVTKIVDRAQQVVGESLTAAGLDHAQVDFFACHQAFLWLRRVAQSCLGLGHARTVDTFPWAGTVSAANLPLVLSVGEREGHLHDGDVVAMFQGGTGMTWSGMVLRWGQ